ncbi:MAG: aminotransferase class V-fold PLP-dependent enzyme [Oscillibacter sp.]|nr:aminotransferase class V-fold PLP-dependent enzyme [Oscillibacter sp.]
MIYLDSAATTFQKPPSVSAAVREAMRRMTTPGRGAYPEALQAAETALACREEIAALFHVARPENVVFTLNATHALNLAIKSAVPKGGRAVISGYEHNAVTRPLNALQAEVHVADTPLFQEAAAMAAFDRLITPGTSAVICNHVSNVFGYIQPVAWLAELCRKRNVPLILDLSQSAGVIELDLSKLRPAFAAMPGHKGLYGPQGTGVLICGEGVETTPLLEGGTGTMSVSQQMPDFLPERLESGTPNIPGIAGLLEGVRFVRRNGVENICGAERRLTMLAADELREIPGVRVFARPGCGDQSAVLSFLPPAGDVERLGDALGARGIAVRAGLHCAPLAHRTAGTLRTGTVRVSFSAFNTAEEVRRFLTAFKEILRDFHAS